jgi:GNAT superfamily N-acetyltransferase
MATLSQRAATLEDYALFGRLFAELRGDDPAPGLDWWTTSHAEVLFVEEDGVPVAYAWSFALGEDGHVNHVVVDATARGRGVGRELMSWVATRLRALGCVRWSLFVREGNAPAIALYRRCGLQLKYESETIMLDWDAVSSLPADAAIEVLPVVPEDDAAIERQLALPVGRLDRSRRMPGRTFVVARQSGAIVGVVVFDAETSGTMVLRARTPAILRALLEGVRPSRGSAHSVRLFLDDAPTLCVAAKAAGGRLDHRALRMEGLLAAFA